MIQIVPVPQAKAHKVWVYCKPYIEQALKHTDGEWSIDTIRNSVFNGKRHLWGILDNGALIAAITTRVDFYPDCGKIGIIDFAGGKKMQKWWSPFTDLAEAYFKSEGCLFMDIAGRKGWERLHTAKDFKHRYTIIRKDIRGT